MLNLTRLHLGIAHESQFQGLGISGCLAAISAAAMAITKWSISGSEKGPRFFFRAPLANLKDLALAAFVGATIG